MKRLLAFCIYCIIWVLTLPPLEILFILERPLAFILQKVLKYRLSIIRTNMSKSFPEKSVKDLLIYEKQYYLWLSRIFIESVKAMHWSIDKLGKRIDVVNPEIFEEFVERNQDIIVLAGHTANWEWSPAAICPSGFDLLGIYKPQSSRTFDLLTVMIRKKKGVIPTPMKGTLRALQSESTTKARPRALLLIADQIPALGDIHFWQSFLNQETAWFTGGEKIALKKKLPVVYLRTKQVKKGKYSAEIIPLYDGEDSMAKLDITKFYIHALEQTILDHPPHWLWSHRRWKHQPEDVSL